MNKKRRKFLSKVVIQNGQRTLKVIGFLIEPQIGEELIYENNGTCQHTGEIINTINTHSLEQIMSPGRVIIKTNNATYVADDLVILNENSRRRSRHF